MIPLESSVTGIAWPALTAPEVSRVLALLFQVELSQWWPPDTIAALQRRQLGALLRHHGLSEEAWERLPARWGSPDPTRWAANDAELTAALLLRHRRAAGLTRPAPTLCFALDPAGLGPAGNPPPAQWDPEHGPLTAPAYVRTTAQGARILAERAADIAAPGTVLAIETFGPPLEEDTRARLTARLGAPVLESLLVPGLGPIAFRCPAAGTWHLAAEGYLAEPQADGTLALSALHGFDVPVLRVRWEHGYRAGSPCRCGRGLPCVTRDHARTAAGALTSRFI